MSTIEFTDQRANARSAPVTRALTQAALAAGGAPTVLGARPWQWQVGDGALRLCLRERSDLRIADPAGRLTTVGCGAALHHALVALAGAGILADVVRLPDPGFPLLMAEIRVTGYGPPTTEAVRRQQALALRHTLRCPVADLEVPEDALGDLRAVAAVYGVRLVPTAEPARHGRTLLLCTRTDTPADWLAAGEAASAAIVAAAVHRLVATPVTESVLPPGTGRRSRTPAGYPVAAVHVAAPRIPALTVRPASAAPATSGGGQPWTG